VPEIRLLERAAFERTEELATAVVSKWRGGLATHRHSLLLSVRAVVSADAHETPAPDETQVSAGAESARSSLLLLWTSRS
jgi:hypothetical protein